MFFKNIPNYKNGPIHSVEAQIENFLIIGVGAFLAIMASYGNDEDKAASLALALAIAAYVGGLDILDTLGPFLLQNVFERHKLINKCNVFIQDITDCTINFSESEKDKISDVMRQIMNHALITDCKGQVIDGSKNGLTKTWIKRRDLLKALFDFLEVKDTQLLGKFFSHENKLSYLNDRIEASLRSNHADVEKPSETPRYPSLR